MEKINIRNLSLFFIIIIVFSIPTIYGYKMESDSEVHQYITYESSKIDNLLPIELINKIGTSILTNTTIFNYSQLKYNDGDNIIFGSAEEDGFPRPINHFWNPDNPNYGNYNDGISSYDSSFNRARSFWTDKIIKNYKSGNIDEAYYWLGRIVHLLQDSTVSSHVLLDPHLDDISPLGSSENSLEFYDDSIYEEYTGENFKDFTVSSLNLTGKQYNYEKLINSWSRTDWKRINWNIDNKNYPENLFKLFWYTAQKTQHFATDDSDGNDIYRSNTGSVTYDFSNEGLNLWSEDDVEIIANKSAFYNGDPTDKNNEDFYYSTTNDASYCEQIYSEFCQNALSVDICYYCDPNEGLPNGGNVGKVSEALMSHSMRATAGLYRLFWDTVNSYHWPTFHHDNRRTGYTILKGDMSDENDLKKIHYVIKNDADDNFYSRNIIANIDKDDYMDVIITVSSKTPESNGWIYVTENKNDKIDLLFAENLGYKMDGAPSAGNTYNDEVRIITGLANGQLKTLNSEGDIKWTFTSDLKYNPNGGNYVRGNIAFNAISDIDLDGKKEIIFADHNDGHDTGWNGTLYILEDKGSYFDLENRINFSNGGAYGAVSIANINTTTDEPEIVVPGYTGIRVFDHNLNLICQNNHTRIEGSAVIYDINKDNEYELIYTTSSYYCTSDCVNKLYIVNALNCQVEDSITLNSYSLPTPAVGDIDGDGNAEIVLTARKYDSNLTDGEILCYNHDLTTCTGNWPYNNNNNLHTSIMAPNIADMDGDGYKDIIFAEGEGTNSGKNIFILDHSGSLVFDDPIKLEGIIGSVPAIGDINNKGVADLVIKRAGSPRSIMSIISGPNQKPKINPIEEITALAGDLIDLNESGNLLASDLDNDVLTFYYSSPFNESGQWQTSINDSGNYSIFVEVSDGNLSDYTYVDVFVFNTTNKVLDQFSDSTSSKSLEFSSAENKTVKIKLPKNSSIKYAKMLIEGEPQ